MNSFLPLPLLGILFMLGSALCLIASALYWSGNNSSYLKKYLSSEAREAANYASTAYLAAVPCALFGWFGAWRKNYDCVKIAQFLLGGLAYFALCHYVGDSFCGLPLANDYRLLLDHENLSDDVVTFYRKFIGGAVLGFLGIGALSLSISCFRPSPSVSKLFTTPSGLACCGGLFFTFVGFIVFVKTDYFEEKYNVGQLSTIVASALACVFVAWYMALGVVLSAIEFVYVACIIIGMDAIWILAIALQLPDTYELGNSTERQFRAGGVVLWLGQLLFFCSAAFFSKLAPKDTEANAEYSSFS